MLLLLIVACGDGDDNSIEPPELTDRWEASCNDGEGVAFELDRVGDEYTFGLAYELHDVPSIGTATIESRVVSGFGEVDALVFTPANGHEAVISAFVFFDGARLELGAFPQEGGFLRFQRR